MEQEKNLGMAREKDTSPYGAHDLDSGTVDEIKRAREIQTSTGILRSMRHAEEWLDSKVGIETQGVDRVPEEDKQPPSIWNALLLWMSLNIHVGAIPLGLLGPEFGLSLGQSISANIVGSALGALCTAYTGTLGPKLGLRQIACSRYAFGFYGAKLCSCLNVITNCGFFVVNLVVCGQILSAVSDYNMTIIVGIIIIAVLSYIISVFGFRLIHTYEKYSWIATFILLCVLIGQAAPHVRPNLPGTAAGSGKLAIAGDWLSIAAINFSNGSGWCSLASDYMVNYPATTKSWKIFGLTFLGLVIATTFSTTIGSMLGNIAYQADINPYANAYFDHGLGGMISTLYHPSAFSKFCLVLLTFSVLGNNIAIIYSSGLSMQLMGHYFHAVPRFVWSLAISIVTAVLAIAGRTSLSNVVDDFVSLLGYWTVSFTLILLLENSFFRRRDGYDLSVWDRPDRLPLGAAAVLALLAGYLAGGVPGMDQTWYIGPIAAKFGPYGGDVGIPMSAAITLVVYPIARTIEKRKMGR